MRNQPRLLAPVVPDPGQDKRLLKASRSRVPGRFAQSSWRRWGHPNCRAFVVLGPDGQEHTRRHGRICAVTDYAPSQASGNPWPRSSARRGHRAVCPKGHRAQLARTCANGGVRPIEVRQQEVRAIRGPGQRDEIATKLSNGILLRSRSRSLPDIEAATCSVPGRQTAPEMMACVCRVISGQRRHDTGGKVNHGNQWRVRSAQSAICVV